MVFFLSCECSVAIIKDQLPLIKQTDLAPGHSAHEWGEGTTYSLSGRVCCHEMTAVSSFIIRRVKGD